MKRLLLSLLIPALAYNGYSQSVTLDSEWDTTAKINTATTDQDFIVQDGTVDLTLLNFTDATTLTASTGAVTATQVLHIIAAESGTADTIDSIAGGATGDILIVRPDTGDTITFADGTAGGDNLDFAGQDVVLDSVNERLVLEYNGTNWVIVAVSPFVMGVSDVTFTDADVAVSAVGEMDYDNTITGLDDGALTWYDDDEIRTIIDLDASEGTLVAGDDLHVITYNWNSGNGYFDLQAGGGGGAGNGLWDVYGPTGLKRFAMAYPNAAGSLLSVHGFDSSSSDFGTNTYQAPSGTEPSYINYATAATVNDYAGWSSGGPDYDFHFDRDLQFSCIVNFDSTTNVVFYAGLANNTGANVLTSLNPANDHALLIYDSATSANWRYATKDTTQNITTSSTAAATGLIHLAITWDGTTVTFYVNGTSIGTSTTNTPTGAGCQPVVGVRTTETVAKNIKVHNVYVDSKLF